MNEMSEVTKDKLITDLKLVILDTEELLRATAGQAGEKMADLRLKAQDHLTAAKIKLAEAETAVVDKAKAVGRATDDFVHDNPLARCWRCGRNWLCCRTFDRTSLTVWRIGAKQPAIFDMNPLPNERPGGLYASARGLGVTTLALLGNRLDLLGTELAEERIRLLSLICYGAAALVFLATGLVFIAVFMTVLLWDSIGYWCWVFSAPCFWRVGYSR